MERLIEPVERVGRFVEYLIRLDGPTIDIVDNFSVDLQFHLNFTVDCLDIFPHLLIGQLNRDNLMVFVGAVVVHAAGADDLSAESAVEGVGNVVAHASLGLAFLGKGFNYGYLVSNILPEVFVQVVDPFVLTYIGLIVIDIQSGNLLFRWFSIRFRPHLSGILKFIDMTLTSNKSLKKIIRIALFLFSFLVDAVQCNGFVDGADCQNDILLVILLSLVHHNQVVPGFFAYFVMHNYLYFNVIESVHRGQ